MRLPSSQVDLWVACLDGYEPPPHLLTAGEEERTARFLLPLLRARFRAARGILRTVLAEYVDAPVRIETTETGKPFLPDHAGLQFNLSHSGAMFACAVTTAGEVGVDVERIDPARDVMAIASRFFSPGEARAIRDARTFFACWTRKEAFLKAGGWGIAGGLDTEIDEGEWSAIAFEPAEGFAGAIVVRCTPAPPVHRIEFGSSLGPSSSQR